MTITERIEDKASSPIAYPGLSDEERRVYDRIPEDVDFVDHASFPRPETEEDLYGASAPAVSLPVWTDFPQVEDEPVARPSGPSRLSGKDEERLFLRYNYALYRLAGLAEAQRKRRTVGRAKAMVLWFRRAMKARADLVRANLALVLAMAKRTKIPNVEFGELVSEGNMALLRSVEKFDVSRGFKFSTYACRSILKAFNRLATKTGKYRKRFPVEFDPDLEQSDYDDQRHDRQRADSIDTVREVILRNEADLSDVERTVVMERFAIGVTGKGKTLSQVGSLVGLTNERVRQIQKLALGKIRGALNEQALAG